MPIYAPKYSHGGATEGPWTAVSGTTTGAGRPISVLGSCENCAMSVTLSAGTATVTIEASGGALDPITQAPAETSWIDQSDNTPVGWDLDASDPTTFLYMSIPALRAPLWRTRITAISGGGTVESFIAFINVKDQNGIERQIPASYPSLSQFTTQGQ